MVGLFSSGVLIGVLTSGNVLYMETTKYRHTYCTADTTSPDGELHAVCGAPFGHAGDHEWVDSQGLCLVTDNCRATRDDGSYAYAAPSHHHHHNH